MRIYDYVDREVPVLLRMFEKRLPTYRAIGYARGEAPLGFAEPPDTDLEDEGEPAEASPGSRRPASPATDPAEARFAADVSRQSRQRILAAVMAAAEAAPLDDKRFAALVRGARV